jgi:hypothetical protein
MIARFRPRPVIEAGQLYRIKDVATYYTKHPVTILRWCDEGRLQRVRVGPRSTMISGDSILRNNQHGSGDAA